MKKIRANVQVFGRVQGVCYRHLILQTAAELGITGWVRNIHNGSVEAVFEGEESVVEKMIELCKKGPTMARVSRIDVDRQPFLGSFDTFKIKSTF